MNTNNEEGARHPRSSALAGAAKSGAGAGIGLGGGSAAQERPIDIAAQVFTAHGADGFALNRDAQAFAEAGLDGKRLAQIADRRATSSGEVGLLGDRQRVQVGAQLVHVPILYPRVQSMAIPAGNLPNSKRTGKSGAMEPTDRKARFEHRRARLAELLRALEPAPRAWFARAIERQEDYIARLLLPAHDPNRKNIGDAIMAASTAALGLAPGWFDLPLGSAIPQGVRLDEKGRAFFDRPPVNRPNGLATPGESVTKITGIALPVGQDLWDALPNEQRSVVQEVAVMLVDAFSRANQPTDSNAEQGAWNRNRGAVKKLGERRSAGSNKKKAI